jgi:hypothetical protein
VESTNNPLQVAPTFGDYVVYVDESGDHSLTSIDPKFPIFVLAFCIFRKEDYINEVSPSLQRLKFRHFGHDGVILHEREIVKATGDFRFLRHPRYREVFLSDLTTVMEQAPFTLIAVAVEKEKLRHGLAGYSYPYHRAMEAGLERLCAFLFQQGQEDRLTTVIFESRGKPADQQLELEFLRVTSGANARCSYIPLRFKMFSKTSNSCGLQLADLVARPIARYVLNSDQPNRAFEILRQKFRRGGPEGQMTDYGLKLLP